MRSILNDQTDSPLDQVYRDTALTWRGADRTLNEEDRKTLNRILQDKYEHVHHELFEEPDAERRIFDEADEVPEPDTSWYHPVMDNQNLSAAPPTKGRKTVLLTAAQERTLFYQYNYARYRVIQVKEAVGDEPITSEQAQELLRWHRKAEKIREQIADTNLALVLAMAKRVQVSDVDFPELISEGNMALLRAIDKFDASRGYKLSTYACRAILKAFSRIGVKTTRHRHMFPTDFDPKLERSDHMQVKRAEHEEDCVDEVRRIIDENHAELSDIEQEVIEYRFGVGNQRHEASRPMTLEQVGKVIGVTKERVRQIQNKALDKIRGRLEDDFLI